MTRTLTLAALLTDNGLPDASRVIGAYIAAHDQGEGIELRHDDIAAILYQWPKADKIRAVLRPLTVSGFVSRSAGGKGRGDVYQWLGVPIGSGQDPTLSIIGCGSETQPKDRVGLEPQPNDDRVGLGPEPNDPRARGASSSTAPPPPPLEARVREAMGSEVLSGCRGSVADYLATGRPERPYGYVQSVAAAIQGANPDWWVGLDGTQYQGDRAAVIAGALNELMQGDEIGKYFPGPPGDIRNLRSKVRHKVRTLSGAQYDATRKATGTDGQPAVPIRRRHVER